MENVENMKQSSLLSNKYTFVPLCSTDCDIYSVKSGVFGEMVVLREMSGFLEMILTGLRIVSLNLMCRLADS